MNAPDNTISQEEWAALHILRHLKAPVLEAALLAKEAMAAGRGRMKRARRCLLLGEEALRSHEKTVSFAHAVDAAIQARKELRPRTVADFRYFCRRLLKRCPGLAKRRIRSLAPADCSRYLSMAFPTPRQYCKARIILSSIFSTAIKHGWCSCNPVKLVRIPRMKERHIPTLSRPEMARLLHTAAEYDEGSCLPAVGMMLYAGIRPHEVARLTWGQVDLANGAISILPRHSKTGGARRVSIHPPLAAILEREKRDSPTGICPHNWRWHWRQVRLLSGWGAAHPWMPDSLRHTFASYYIVHFRSYPALQYETGHRSSELLRTRYVDTSGVEDAADFWKKGCLALPC